MLYTYQGPTLANCQKSLAKSHRRRAFQVYFCHDRQRSCKLKNNWPRFPCSGVWNGQHWFSLQVGWLNLAARNVLLSDGAVMRKASVVSRLRQQESTQPTAKGPRCYRPTTLRQSNTMGTQRPGGLPRQTVTGNVAASLILSTLLPQRHGLREAVAPCVSSKFDSRHHREQEIRFVRGVLDTLDQNKG